MNTDVLFSHKSDEWETPTELFKQLDQEFRFTLDPCCTDKTAKCKKYYTKIDNGLSFSWERESVFVNPPYSQLLKWVQKCFEESRNATVVMLIPARTDTKWFHNYIYGKAEIRFLKGRVKFSGAKNGAPFPSMVVIFRNKRKEVTE